MSDGQQYLRTIKLVVFDNTGNGIDLSDFRIKFCVKRSDTMTPNVADIRVYNLSQDSAMQIFNHFSAGSVDTSIGAVVTRGRVLLQAGYESNFGVVFQGNIKQIIVGRESATDTFVDIIAGDGDRAYNFAVVNTSLAKGSTFKDQINAAAVPMAQKGVTAGNLGSDDGQKLPRGKVMYGSSKNYMRNIAQSTDQGWSIQDEKITFIPKKSFLPGTVIEITSNTGMIGTPQQTTAGVNVKCLLNPLIKMGSRIKIDNKSIARFKIDLSQTLTAANIPAPLTADGTYYVMVCEHSGDTRGVEWYSSVVSLNMNISTNPINSVQPGYGGSV